MSQGCKGEAFLQGAKCQHSNGGVLGRAVLRPVGLNRSLTRAEKTCFLLVFLSSFSLMSVVFPVVEKAMGSSRHE